MSLYVYIISKETNIIASNSNKKKRKWLNFENWSLKIYIRIIKHYTDIDPSVNTHLVFPVYKIDRKQSEKTFLRNV
jgi:hypothetical protein